jgi:predicted PurR-regulated permease PerM
MKGEAKGRGMRDTLEWAIRTGRNSLPRPVFVPPEARLDEPAPTPTELAATEPKPQLTLAAAGVALLAALALLYTLYVARALILPVVVAILLSFLLRPAVRMLRRARIREPIGAAIVVLGGVAILGTSIMLLSAPARSWAERAPAAMGEVERKLRRVTASFVRWEQTAAKVEQIASGTTGPATARTPAAAPPRTPFLRRAFGGVATVFPILVSIIFLTYFLLASGDLFMRKMMRMMPKGTERELPRKISEEVETSVSRYLRTAVMINVGLGLATWGVLSLLDMPNAALWGSVAGLLNIVPYLGAMLTLVILAIAAITSFDTIGQALMVPGAFLLLNILESNIITPALMGRQFPLNTPALFIGIMFWGFIWGIAGAILAVPMMVTLKILCDHIPTLRPLGEFLGQ